MVDRGNLSPVKRNRLGSALLLTLVSLICVAFSLTGSDDFEEARREILLRRIGHEVLLQSGDSDSRVLPVKRIAKGTYEISFERAITFEPDSLVAITRRLLAGDGLAGDYVVNVLNCADSSVAYGYAISGNKKDDIIACQGRRQPEACYRISIRLASEGPNRTQKGYLLGGLALLAVTGYVFWKPAGRKTHIPEEDLPEVGEDDPTSAGKPASGMFTLGSMLFDPEARRLLTSEKAVELTKTETRVLRMFAMSPNEVIERSRLQKEIWEDEGVIVGRSLDMFISKLRKKLKPAPDVRIAVVRGRGYRLEISAGGA